MKDGIAMAQDKDITELDFKFRLIQWYHKPELFYEDFIISSYKTFDGSPTI